MVHNLKGMFGTRFKITLLNPGRTSNDILEELVYAYTEEFLAFCM